MLEFFAFLFGFIAGWVAKGYIVCRICCPKGDCATRHPDTTPIPASRFRAGKRRGEAGG